MQASTHHMAGTCRRALVARSCRTDSHIGHLAWRAGSLKLSQVHQSGRVLLLLLCSESSLIRVVAALPGCRAMPLYFMQAKSPSKQRQARRSVANRYHYCVMDYSDGMAVMYNVVCIAEQCYMEACLAIMDCQRCGQARWLLDTLISALMVDSQELNSEHSDAVVAAVPCSLRQPIV